MAVMVELRAYAVANGDFGALMVAIWGLLEVSEATWLIRFHPSIR